MSPEIIELNKKGSFDGFMADIWSLGVTMFCVAYLKLPFYGDSLSELSNNICN